MRKITVVAALLALTVSAQAEVRATFQNDDVSPAIVVFGTTFPFLDGKSFLFEGSVEASADSYTNNELRKINRDLTRKLSKMKKDDIPPIYFKMVRELRAVMDKRGVRP